MDQLEFWKYSDTYTIVQAALLLAGHDPSKYESEINTETSSPNHPEGFDGMFAALKSSIESGNLKAKFISQDYASILVIGNDYDEKELIEEALPDWKATTVKREDLKRWIYDRGLQDDFLSRSTNQSSGNTDLLDIGDEFYAYKLNAAIKAWSAVTKDESLRRNKSPSKAIEEWLQDNAAKLGLIHTRDKPKNKIKKGDINTEAIKQICKVVNWQTQGGVPKTPITSNLPTPESVEE